MRTVEVNEGEGKIKAERQIDNNKKKRQMINDLGLTIKCRHLLSLSLSLLSSQYSLSHTIEGLVVPKFKSALNKA